MPMPTLTIVYRDDAERLALEQAIAYVAQLRQVAAEATDGSVLAACELMALAEVAGWDLDDNTLRQLCHATAAEATAHRDERATAAAFAEAPGDLELHIDAGKVNTHEGWRDVKVAVFARRERGEPTTAAQWDERDLPAPAVRAVVS